jgi:hypothetical protein
MSLLLVSCAYRPGPAGAAHDEATTAIQRDARATTVVTDAHQQIDPVARAVHSDGFAHTPRRARAVAASHVISGDASGITPFLGPMDDMDVETGTSGDDLSMAPSPATAETAPPAVPSSTIAATPSNAGSDDAGRTWPSHWWVLTALFIIILSLLSLRGHRRKVALRTRRLARTLPSISPPAAPEARDSDALSPADSREGKRAPPVLSWVVGNDPLANEDWSIQVPVDYSPQVTPTVAAILAGAATQAVDTATTEADADHVADAVASMPQGVPDTTTETAAAASSDLLARIEAIAIGDGHAPRFFLDDDGYLPVISHAEHAPPPTDLSQALERTLLDHADPTGELATWLLVQVQAWRMASVGRHEVDTLHQAAFALALHGWERASATVAPHWLARLIAIDLAQARRLSGAARLLALRNMAMRYADDIERGEGPVLKAWIGVLLYWAQHQMGDGALAHYAEAAALAERLRGIDGVADDGQLLLAETMRHRAGVELGGVRTQTLDDAQELLDELFAREPSGRVAFAIAQTALARGRHAMPAVAKEAFSHALTHAFLAGSDPRWQEDSLQCRLAIQLAYEALPDMPVQGRVALDLAHRLEQVPTPSGDTLERVAHAFVRHAEYARACRLCAEAWRAKAATEALLAAWRQASGHWAQRLTTPGERAAWQENERQRRLASQMH